MPELDVQPGCFGGLFQSALRRKLKFLSSAQDSSKQLGNNHDHDAAKQDGRLKEGEGAQIPCRYFSNPACDFSYDQRSECWSALADPPPYIQLPLDAPISRQPEVFKTIENKIDELSPNLRKLSLQIHAHPELMFNEKFAHDLLTGFMSDHGFYVTKHYLGLDTAWRAEFKQGIGGRVLGVNCEMDALSGMGHACGHNLIAASGVGIAIAIKAALETHNIPGEVVVLGTPAEEGGGGKIILLERGGYTGMDACIMCHPGVGPSHSVNVGTTIALQGITVEYFGHAAHAGAAPWEGTNALDAAFLAYSGISVLRQQLRPDHRIHGIVHGKDWSPNVIPDYASMRWYVRTPTHDELAVCTERVKTCFEAAALATSCKIKITVGSPYFNLNQNHVLAEGFADIVGHRYGQTTCDIGTSASTDFGNVSHNLPALHPIFAIPTVPQGGNHTPEFAKAARTEEAHEATMTVTKGLSMLGLRVLNDDRFFIQVKNAFDMSKG